MFTNRALLRERGKLGKFALRLTQNRSDADDLLQSTLLRAFEKKDYFQDNTNLFGWTSKIMFNLFAAQYRRKNKFETRYDPMPYIERAAVPAAQEASAEMAKVRSCMKRLSREHREILILICMHGLRYEEASEKLNIPVGTIRSRLFRARKQLQSMLENPATFAEKGYPVSLSKKAYGGGGRLQMGR